MYTLKPTPRPFTVTTSCHNMPALEIMDASKELHAYLRGMIHQCYVDHEHYKLRMAAGAFLQGGHSETEGWILIEFWQSREAAQAFVDYVNKHAQHL